MVPGIEPTLAAYKASNLTGYTISLPMIFIFYYAFSEELSYLLFTLGHFVTPYLYICIVADL